MDSHMDLVGLVGLIVALIALGVAIYGVRDVREQVKFLVMLERNVVFSKELHFKALQFVELVDDAQLLQSRDMHGLSMLVRAIDSKQTLDSVQEYMTKESLSLAREMVSLGLAKWRGHIGENEVNEVLRNWQNDKNAAVLRKILDRPSLAGPDQTFMS
jgi:hypothetical protein